MARRQQVQIRKKGADRISTACIAAANTESPISDFIAASILSPLSNLNSSQPKTVRSTSMCCAVTMSPQAPWNASKMGTRALTKNSFNSGRRPRRGASALCSIFSLSSRIACAMKTNKIALFSSFWENAGVSSAYLAICWKTSPSPVPERIRNVEVEDVMNL